MAGSDERRDVTVEIDGVESSAEAGDIGAKTRHRRPNKRNYDIEIVEGDDWTADKGRFSSKIRIVDKPNDWYLEIVVDKETGRVIHFDSTRLSEKNSRDRD